MDSFTLYTELPGPEMYSQGADLPVLPSPSSSTEELDDSGVPMDFEYTNNNYSHSWCTIA
ncbi:hypothetical protein V8D89_008032 [Ganoderma adspersum]